MNIVVLVVDRLHAGFLGCYGNAWVATPHFNRLAVEGFLFDQAFVDQPQLDQLCRTWWSGTHRLERLSAGNRPQGACLASEFANAGFMTACLTDEPIVADRPLAARFGEIVRVEAPVGDSATGSLEETHLGHFFATAVAWLETAREPFFLWLHSRGMAAPWDAPEEFRLQYADEEESPPPRIAQPPCRLLTADDDPDELWGICQSYAGQVTLLDECLGGWLESLDAQQLLDDTLLVVFGARGFPLGRNGRLGDIDGALYNELVQVPWLIRFPDGLGAAGRSGSLVQACDLAPTLLDLAGLPFSPGRVGGSLLPLVGEEKLSLRDRILLVGRDGERGFRTPAWYLRTPVSAAPVEQPPPELYAKPDDRWEINDVATRCPETFAALNSAQEELANQLAGEEPLELSPLDEALVSDLR